MTESRSSTIILAPGRPRTACQKEHCRHRRSGCGDASNDADITGDFLAQSLTQFVLPLFLMLSVSACASLMFKIDEGAVISLAVISLLPVVAIRLLGARLHEQ